MLKQSPLSISCPLSDMRSGLHCGGGFCCWDDVLLDLAPLGCLRLFIIGCLDCSCGNGWRGDTIGNRVAAVACPLWESAVLVLLGPVVVVIFTAGLGRSPLRGCLACLLGFFPPLIVEIVFLSKSFMRWRRVCRVTPSLLGIFFRRYFFPYYYFSCLTF